MSEKQPKRIEVDKSDIRSLRVFGLFYYLGDTDTMHPFLDREFKTMNDLRDEITKIKGLLEEEPEGSTIDETTGVVVDHYKLLNVQGELAGMFDIVHATDDEYYELKKSAGHFDLSK